MKFPSGSADRRWALPIASEDVYAKLEVAKFIDTIGCDAVDCGALADCLRKYMLMKNQKGPTL